MKIDINQLTEEELIDLRIVERLRFLRQARALFKAGIPATAFICDDVHAEFTRLKAQGVRFRGEPAKMGTATGVVFDDTCGNLISIVQPD